MKICIEFYRTRDRDEAHAVLGRATREVKDLDEAIEIARGLLETLEMPQWPDAMTISDADGKELGRRAIAQRAEHAPVPSGDLFISSGNDRHE